MFKLTQRSCFPRTLVAVNVGLACIDGIIAVLAFYQLMRIHLRTSRIGWTRQKVFHFLIGSSNIGYVLYFVLTLVAACKRWRCWTHACGFIFMALSKILLLAAFLLVLSYWVDLCHQGDEEDDEDEECGTQDPLLEKRLDKPRLISTDGHRRWFPFRLVHIGSRQKIVAATTVLVIILMIASALLMWIGTGKNPIDSLVVARVYVDCFAVAILLLGGALACYGILLCMKMRRVRSERASSEMWKVAGLSIVSVVSFTSSAVIALSTNIPVLYHWPLQHADNVYTSLLLITYYFIGSSLPSGFVLWVMRELPPLVTAVQGESRTIAYIRDSSAAVHHPQRWTMAASSQNQVSKASPI